MENALADLVIRAKDGHGLTKRLMDSISDSGAREKLNIILVDDGSRPAYEDLGQDVTVRHHKNRGAVSATNSGITAAMAVREHDGRPVIIMDNDAYVPEGDTGWLDRWLAALQDAPPQTGAMGATSDMVNPPQQVLYAPDTYTAKFENGEKVAPAAPQFVSFAVMIKRQVLAQCGLWDERYNPGNYEDTDYSITIRQAGWEIRVAQSVYMHHDGHQTFGTDLQPLLNANMQKMIEKWGIGRLADLKMIPLSVARDYFAAHASARS